MVDIQSLLYAKLQDASITSIVDDRCYPVENAQDAQNILLTYNVEYGSPYCFTNCVPLVSADNMITIDCRDIHLGTVSTLANAVVSLLHGWRDFPNGIQICRLESRAVEPDEEYYHVVLRFKVFA